MTNQEITAAINDARMNKRILIESIDNLADFASNGSICGLIDKTDELIDRLERTLAVRETAKLYRGK